MFKILKDISVIKNGRSLMRSDFEDEYNPYMIQRWLSMYSDINVEILNASVNIIYKSIDEEQQFMLLSSILPSAPMSGKYIKAKGKVNKKSKKDVVDISKYFEESSTKIEESLILVNGDKNKWVQIT